jgi:hypothetical protein
MRSASRQSQQSQQRHTTVDLSEIGQLGKSSCVAEGDIGDAVVNEGRLDRQGRGFLSTTETTSGDEHAGEFAVQFALLPEVAG